MKKLKEKGIGGTVGFMIYLLMGAFVGLTIAVKYDLSDFGMSQALKLWLALILLFYPAMLIQLIVHEGGHLFFGLLSGYKFLSFRIFSTIWVKQDGRIVKRKYSIPGTAGQCLLYPCEYNNGDYPYFLYNLGGGLMNIIVSIILLFIADAMTDKGLLWLFLIFTVYYGFALAALNLIPMRMNGVSNDGKNLCSLKKDAGARKALWCQLFINACTTDGAKYSDLEQWLYDTDGIDFRDPLGTYIYAVNATVCIENGEFEKAYEIFELLLSDPVVAASPSGLGAAIERAYLMILFGMDKEEVQAAVTGRIRKYIKASAVMPFAKRFEYAYELYINNNIYEAEKKEAEFEKSLELYPNRGSIFNEKVLFSAVKEKYFVEFSENDV